MRTIFAAALALGVALAAPQAFAQASAGFPPTPSGNTPSHIEGSGQGSYLGQDPGENVTPPPRRTQLGMLPNGTRIGADSPPTAYCDAASMEPDRCRSRADIDHKMCAGRDPAHYFTCRQTLDHFGWRL